MKVFTADEVTHAVFKALGIDVPERLTRFTLEVDYNGGPPTITMTTLPSKPPESVEAVTKQFRLEPIEESGDEAQIRENTINAKAWLDRILEGVIRRHRVRWRRLIFETKHVEGCPDCYVGLSGQIEKCEKHRDGTA